MIGRTIVSWVLALAVMAGGLCQGSPVQCAAGATARFGVIVGGKGAAPQIVDILKDLGVGWVRLNCHLDGRDPDFARYLDAGVNLIITMDNHDPANSDTTYGTSAKWIHAGFPFRSKAAYQQRIRDVLSPLLPYLARGRRIWVQCENEIGDASMAKSMYWRGTIDQYLIQERACYEAVKGLDPSIPVVLSSFPSEALEMVINPSSSRHGYAVARLTKMLGEGRYDAVDLHFYGCVESIPAKVAWVKARLPAGAQWISTENGGPDDRCAATPGSWRNDPAAYERLEAQQVPARLSAAAENGAAICLWFSLFDLNGEVEVFSHMGLIAHQGTSIRKKPAYDAFKAFTATHR